MVIATALGMGNLATIALSIVVAIPVRWTRRSARPAAGLRSQSLLVAGAAAYPANHWLLARGKGHAVVHARKRAST